MLQVLDADENGNLSFEELRTGLAKFPLEEPISLTPDDFEVLGRCSQPNAQSLMLLGSEGCPGGLLPRKAGLEPDVHTGDELTHFNCFFRSSQRDMRCVPARGS